MLIFWSLVRNSVVLAVYLLFSVACFLTVHEHLLRCVQIGLHISELDLLTIGTVNDMYSEMDMDDYPFAEVATQAQMDRF